MVRFPIIPILLLSLVVCGNLLAQTLPAPSPSLEPDKTDPRVLEELKAKAIQVHIGARIVNEKEVIWFAEQNRVTVHGLKVSIRMESPNLLILTEITPYRQDEHTVLLVIQNQLWIRSLRDGQLRYFTSLNSAPVIWGETIYFYPLGKREIDAQNVINMEFSVMQYADSKGGKEKQ